MNRITNNSPEKTSRTVRPPADDALGTLTIQPATDDDAAVLASVQTAAWRTTYYEFATPAYLNNMCNANDARRWRDIVHDPHSRILVALLHGLGTGFVRFGDSRNEDTDPTQTGEIHAIYILPQYWRAGIGRRLCAAACRALTDQGFRDCILWVIEQNAHARRFYEAMGFTDDGTRSSVDMGQPVTLVRYYRTLPAIL